MENVRQIQATEQLRRSLRNTGSRAMACDVSSEQLSAIITRGASTSRAEQSLIDNREEQQEDVAC